MKSLKYSVLENALRAINAGCNLALYCDGKYQVSRKLLKIPPIDEFTAKKHQNFINFKIIFIYGSKRNNQFLIDIPNYNGLEILLDLAKT